MLKYLFPRIITLRRLSKVFAKTNDLNCLVWFLLVVMLLLLIMPIYSAVKKRMRDNVVHDCACICGANENVLLPSCTPYFWKAYL